MSIYVRDEHGVLQALKIPAYKGEKGEAGVTPNLQVGDVVTLEAGQQATIVRRGDDENPIFDFSIPKGDDGKDGIYVGKVDDAPDHAQVVVNDDPTPYDLFFENANVDYMGNTYTSLKEKADADIEYLLRKFGTQHYEGQNITATDTYAKQVKSAMFKGISKKVTANGEIVDEDLKAPILDYDYFFNHNSGALAPYNGARCTHYLTCPTVRFKLQTSGSYPRVIFYDSDKTFISGLMPSQGQIIEPVANAKYIRISISTPADIYVCDESGKKMDVFGNLETTLQSAKSPVLTATGKNLFKYSDVVSGAIIWSTSNNVNIFKEGWYQETTDGIGFRLKECIKVKPSTKYYANFPYSMHFMQYKANGELIKGSYPNTSTGYITTSSETHYINLFPSGGISGSAWSETRRQEFQNCYISESEAMTSYEPYKSTTLTTPQGLILRGVGDVHDTLDLNTGEHTVWTTEKVLNGEEKWTIAGGWSEGKTIAFTLDYSHRSGVQFICDKFNVVTKDLHITDSEGFMPLSGLKIAIRIDKAKASTLDEFKRWLSQNNTTIIHKIGDNPVKKTVDLKGQKVYSYDGTTHYTTKSLDGHPAPILSIDVPTNTTTMIARQREEIQTLSVENEALKEEVVVANQQRKDGDVELLGYNFDLDFRLMEIECSLDLPISLRTKGVKDVNTYKTAKTLILAGNYERADMEHKLAVYLKRGRLTQEEYDELIALMDAREMVE